MNKTILALVVASGISFPIIAYTERENIKTHVAGLLYPPKMTEEKKLAIDYMLLDAVEQRGSKSEGIVYDCLQNIPEECYQATKE